MNVSAAEIIQVAAQVRSALEIAFAHWQDCDGFDFEAEFTRWVDAVAPMTSRRDFSLETMRFMARLNNGHTTFNDRWLWRTQGQPTGFRVKKLRDAWAVSQSAVPALRPGDTLATIDGEPIPAWVERALPYISASTAWSRLDAVFTRYYLMPPTFTLGLGDGRSVEIERGQYVLPQSLTPTLTHAEPPILRIPSFGAADHETRAVDLVLQHRDRPGLIIDIRGNGGGNTPLRLLAALMDRPWSSWAEETPTQSGLHYAHGERPEKLRFPPHIAQPAPDAYAGKLIILADEGTGSAAEDFLAPFKHNGRATIFGRTTAGTSGQPFVRDFGNDMVLVVGAKRELFPDGSQFEGVGIAPDIPVELTVEHLSAGVDPDLDEATAQLANT